jgi:hypothetical protein
LDPRSFWPIRTALSSVLSTQSSRPGDIDSYFVPVSITIMILVPPFPPPVIISLPMGYHDRPVDHHQLAPPPPPPPQRTLDSLPLNSHRITIHIPVDSGCSSCYAYGVHVRVFVPEVGSQHAPAPLDWTDIDRRILLFLVLHPIIPTHTCMHMYGYGYHDTGCPPAPPKSVLSGGCAGVRLALLSPSTSNYMLVRSTRT